MNLFFNDNPFGVYNQVESLFGFPTLFKLDMDRGLFETHLFVPKCNLVQFCNLVIYKDTFFLLNHLTQKESKNQLGHLMRHKLVFSSSTTKERDFRRKSVEVSEDEINLHCLNDSNDPKDPEPLPYGQSPLFSFVFKWWPIRYKTPYRTSINH